jgi:phosphatidylserine/phosphatidylglycerophosphate/cardiolipin synthase-like enzyme
VVSLDDAGEFQLFFFPCFGLNPLDAAITRLATGSTVRIAASHVSDPHYLKLISALVQRGVEVTLIAHHTQRRSPESAMKYLRTNGLRVYRYEHPDELPMHDKYILAEGPEGRWCMFGSFNMKRRSRWLNDELLVRSINTALWERLDERWRQTIAEPWCTG